MNKEQLERFGLKQQQLWRALRTLESIARNPPRIMHDVDGHEVLVYSGGFNPTKMARECLVEMSEI